MPYIAIGGVLYHYGIRGMQWGKRRFQNKDGSLTEAGKRRYAKAIRKEALSSTGKYAGQRQAAKKVAEDIVGHREVLEGMKWHIEIVSSKKRQDEIFSEKSIRIRYISREPGGTS